LPPVNDGIGLYTSSPGALEFQSPGIPDNVMYVANTEASSIENRWVMVTITADGTNVRGYIDTQINAEYGTVGITGTVDPNNYTLNINTRMNAYTSSPNTFGIKVDELGFWNRALTTNEISDLYNSSIGKFYPFS
jgi:hypothetical protein